MRLVLLLFCASLGLPLARATPLSFSSGSNRVHLVELYTSEGCSSCPPAEQWLGRLSAAPGLWRDFVPVAFHVVYWDHLGWKDRFASRTYTERQYAYAQRWGGNKVYTPGFVLNGEEWRGAFGFPPKTSRTPAATLTLTREEVDRWRVEFSGGGTYEIHVALLGSGITSRVAAGENGGRTLQHDFVALSLHRATLAHGVATVALPRPRTDDGMTRHAIAAWITPVGHTTPVQATGGWLD